MFFIGLRFSPREWCLSTLTKRNFLRLQGTPSDIVIVASLQYQYIVKQKGNEDKENNS